MLPNDNTLSEPSGGCDTEGTWHSSGQGHSMEQGDHQTNYIIEEQTTSSWQSGLYQGHMTDVFDSEPLAETCSISPATKSHAGCNFRV